jgi:hypothetical protein
VGVLGVAGILAAAAWFSGAARRVVGTLPSHPYFTLGALLALVPFAVHNLCVWLGVIPFAHSLPIWIRAPWDVAVNLHDGAEALGPLVGCDPHGAASVLVGQGVDLPEAVWPRLVRGLEWATPAAVALALGLIASVAWRDRLAWRRFWGLRGEGPTPPTVLALLALGVTALLYILQATSPNSSSIRYLVPAWIVLPGLLASGIRALPRPRGVCLAILLLGPWALAQVNLWAELDRPSPLRPLADELERRGVKGIVAETPVALMVANLTHGRVGALEYHSKWPRLGDRYADRFPEGRPVTCVVDTQLTWHPGEDPTGSLLENIGPALRRLAARRPTRVRLAWRVSHFEAWDVDLPLAEILPEGENPLSHPPASVKLAGESATAD